MKRQDTNGTRPRSWDQLRHDALVIELGLQTNTTTSTSGGSSATGTGGAAKSGSSSTRNQIIVVADASALVGDPSASIEIPGVGAIPRNVLERLGCDADLYGHIFGAHGTSLWHGRAVRTTTAQQWRTLVARDRGCVLCAAAPAYCQAHHIVPWSLGGRTDADNLVLLCERHHHELHDHNQTLTRNRDGTWQLQPRAGPHPQPSTTPRPRTPTRAAA